MKTLDVLDSVKIAAPCRASWDAMAGDDRVRYCGECRLHVYNFAGMTRAEIDALVREKEGRLCGRLFRRVDGTILTADCPVGVARVRRKWAMIGGAFAALLAVVGGGLFAKRDEIGRSTRDSRLRQVEPFRTVLEWLFPSPVQIELGRIAVPPKSTPPPANGSATGEKAD